MQRRRLLIASSSLALTGAAFPARGASPTPAQSAGPFYPERLPLDHDNDLIVVAGAGRRARGVVLHLSGQVLDLDGGPVPGALVEIWQCDGNGRYHHPGDRRAVAPDPGFQGYGRFSSGSDGGYRFRTIRPVAYPGRTPHIHFAVTAPDGARLVTQMYVHGEPGNHRDGLFSRIPQELRHRVLVALAPAPGGAPELSARFDIVLPT
jgi:protocatechuate 3,4-dioxygenase beta subunit